ncbi:MAG: F420-dependent oxidoreductase-like protein [Candidatus Aldehydirespiratoraceae bacterium]|jgi:F420-dependent oxidoreductase-like protein
MTRLGYQIPNFTYPGVAADGIFDNVVEQAKTAEASGFDRVLLMDHFYQLPGIGDPDDYMLECYTMLGALAQHTDTVRLSALVTGNTYRNPAVLAKTVTALDHVSHGRATLGIGSGWFELEHDAFGIPFNSFTERFEKLEEALNIILPMLRGERPTLDGKHYQVAEAINSPAPVSKIPVMIGGSGEKKTLRMVAQYADESNLTCTVDEIPRKLDALAAHCEALGRDRSEIAVTKLVMMVIGHTMEEAEASMVTFVEDHGWPTEIAELMAPRMTVGGPDEISAAIQELVDAGIDGVTLNLVANAHDPELIALAGKTASAVLPS